MNEEKVMIDFVLPNTPDTLKFIKLNQSDKLKAIALGMRFLSTGTQQLQLWDNSQWETRIEQIKTQKQEKINALQEKLQSEITKTQKLIQRQQAEVNVIIEGVRNRTESKFLGEIASLNDNVERLQNKINLQQNEKTQLYKSINDEFYSKILSKEQLWEAKIEKLRTTYEEKLEKERERTAACILTTKHSTIKGQAGEEFTHQELNRRFPTAEIEDTHKQPGRGDFIMREHNFIMLIETKNYKNNVTKPEIEKFYRDMATNNDIQCGLFLSLKSGICNRDDLHLEVIDGKPIIFVHNCLKNMENIDFAVRIFKLILNTDSIDLSNKEVYEKIKNTIPMVKRYWNKMRSKIQKFEKDMTQCVLEQETMVRDIFKLLGFNY
jgi:hypothetical protein